MGLLFGIDCSSPVVVPFKELTNRCDTTDWSTSDTPTYRHVTLIPQRVPLECFLIFDDQESPQETHRNRLLSTRDWAWYGNVVVVCKEGDWPVDYVTRTSLIRSALHIYCSDV